MTLSRLTAQRGPAGIRAFRRKRERFPAEMPMTTFQKVTLATGLVLCVALLLPKMLLSRGRKDAERPDGASAPPFLYGSNTCCDTCPILRRTLLHIDDISSLTDIHKRSQSVYFKTITLSSLKRAPETCTGKNHKIR